MYIARLKAYFQIFHFLVDISNMLRINATSKRVSQASIWRRWSFGTTFCLISCLKNFLWKTSTFSSKNRRGNQQEKKPQWDISAKKAQMKKVYELSNIHLSKSFSIKTQLISRLSCVINWLRVWHMVISDLNFFSQCFLHPYDNVM